MSPLFVSPALAFAAPTASAFSLNQQGRRLSLSDNPFESARLEFDGLPSPEATQHQAKKSARKPPEEAAAEKLEQAKKAEEKLEKKTGKGKTAKNKR